MNSKTQLQLLHQLRTRQSIVKQGFTLVELMIVVAIIGLLSAVALPQFLGARSRADSKSKIGELVGIAKECAIFQIEADIAATPIRTPSGTTVICGGSPATTRSLTSQAWSGAGTVRCLNTTISTQTRAIITVNTDGSMACAGAA